MRDDNQPNSANQLTRLMGDDIEAAAASPDSTDAPDAPDAPRSPARAWRLSAAAGCLALTVLVVVLLRNELEHDSTYYFFHHD